MKIAGGDSDWGCEGGFFGRAAWYDTTDKQNSNLAEGGGREERNAGGRCSTLALSVARPVGWLPCQKDGKCEFQVRQKFAFRNKFLL